MQTSVSPILLLTMLVGILAVAGIVIGFMMRPAEQSRAGVVVAGLPGLVMLVLFYSLAAHMYQALEGWPSSIGTHGFPAALNVHASAATTYFAIVFLVSISIWPLAFFACALVPRWRSGLYYLGVYALACFACFGAMLLAPAEFLYWWWD
jgi:hypothetical protein